MILWVKENWGYCMIAATCIAAGVVATAPYHA